MRAIYFHKAQVHLRDDIPQPTINSASAFLKPRLRGICGTDKALLKGYANFSGIPGHEFVADVIALGDEVNKDWLGKRVVSSINIGCGTCEACRQNMAEHCSLRNVIGIRHHDGAFADMLVAPVKNLLAVPDTLTDQQAVFAEPLAAALRIEQQLAAHHYQQVLIIGAGSLGQLIARVMIAAGKQVSIICRHQHQRTALQGLKLNILDETSILTASADVVIEASGSEQGLALALRAVRPRGAIVIKSSYHHSINLDLTMLMVNEVSLIGSRCGDLAAAIDALHQQRIDVTPLIDGCYPLADARSAFDHACRPGALKVLLD